MKFSVAAWKAAFPVNRRLEGGSPRTARPTTGGSRCCATAVKCADFLAGRYGNLSTEEIEEFREAQADPNGSKWEREHAGEAFFVDPLELNEFLLVEMPSGETLEESLAHLRRIVGAHTITPARLWWIAKHKLTEKEMNHDR
jgi:hypothetical protein